MPTLNIIESGLARCVAEPRGANGLEGYVLGQSYRFERCEGKRRRYCRVYPDGSFPGSYETCGEVIFTGLASRPESDVVAVLGVGAKTPRWVYVVGIHAIVLALLFLVAHLVGGGLRSH